jgi:long-subunit fatty acid transport protein
MYFDSKYGYKLNDKWELFTALNFLSQFSKGYKYEDDVNGAEQSLLVSDIFAPAFITSSWGAEYHPTSYFKLRLAPFAPRLTIVHDPTRFTKTVGPEPYGVDSTKTTRFEWLAFQLMADFNKDIATNVNLKWRYMMFANYETIEPKTIDHRLDLTLSIKVGKYVNVGFGAILLYDYDQDTDAQISQVFSIGLGYSFRNYEEK